MIVSVSRSTVAYWAGVRKAGAGAALVSWIRAKASAASSERYGHTATAPTLDELEIHISTLAPGKSPHAPHQHQHEELLIIKEGTLETFQSGATRRVGAGGIIFQASNELHNVTNVGTTPATYFVIGWEIPGAKK